MREFVPRAKNRTGGRIEGNLIAVETQIRERLRASKDPQTTLVMMMDNYREQRDVIKRVYFSDSWRESKSSEKPKCVYCNGRGWFKTDAPGWNSFWNTKRIDCNKCNGTGRRQ